MLAHHVYFTLTDNSTPAREALLAACHKYLSKHDGIQSFAVGRPAIGLEREVNDRDFDVALAIVFRDRAAHDAYQDNPSHHQFIDEQKANWKNVRVFDIDLIAG